MVKDFDIKLIGAYNNYIALHKFKQEMKNIKQQKKFLKPFLSLTKKELNPFIFN